MFRYAAYRYCDSGTHGNVVYILDGGSIALRDDKMWLARVGEHHNTPEYGSYAADANTVLCLPVDMNALSLCMPEMVRLHDMGRMVVCVAPTASFGKLHGKLELSNGSGGVERIGVNDLLRVRLNVKDTSYKRRPLIVLSWGPDAKFAAEALEEAAVDAELLLLSYNRCCNALVRHVEEALERNSSGVDILIADSNPNCGVLGPVVGELKRRLGHPRNLFVAEATIQTGYIPYGYGDALFQKEDVLNGLRAIGALA